MKIARLIASLLIFGLLFGLSSAKVSATEVSKLVPAVTLFGSPPGYNSTEPEVTKVVGATTFLWHEEVKIIAVKGYTQTITTPGYYTYDRKSIDGVTMISYNPVWHEAKIEYVWHEAKILTEPGYYTSSATSGYYTYDISNLHGVWALKATKLGYYKHVFILGGFDEAGTFVIARWAYLWIPGDAVQVWLP